MTEDKALEQLARFILNNNLTLTDFFKSTGFTSPVLPPQTFATALVKVGISEE